MSVLSLRSSPLPEALPRLIGLDQVSVPESVWLSDEEIELLNQAEGLAVLAEDGDTLVGGAYAVPSLKIAPLLA